MIVSCFVGYVAVCLGTLPMLLVGLLITALQRDVGRIFTADVDIVAKVAAVVPICAAYLIVDAVGNTSSGVLR